MGKRHYYRRSDLFLVRLWAEETGDATDGKVISDGNVEWRGKVQRVTDGESHQFNDWQDLCNLLLAMVSNKKGATAGDNVPG